MAQQPPSYASPITGQQIRRSEMLAEAIRKMGQQPREVYNTAAGTGMTLLADAIRDYSYNKASRKADEGLKADRANMSENVLGRMFPGDEAQAAYPDQFSEQQLADTKLSDAVRGIFDATGDMGTALQYGLGEKTRLQERQDKLEEPFAVPRGATLVGRNGFGGVNTLFDNPDPAAASPGDTVHSAFIGPDGKVTALMRNAAEHPTSIIAQDSFGTFDAGGVPGVISRRTGAGAPVAVGAAPGPDASPLVTAQDVAANKGIIAAGEAAGKRQEQAQADLPNEIASADDAVAVLETFRDHPGFNDAYGLNTYLPSIRGSNRSNAEALRERITSQAFLNSIKSITGLAPVTEAEGLKLTKAQTILGTPDISEAQAKQAVNDLIDVTKARRERAKGRASTGPLNKRLVRDKNSGEEYYVVLRNGQWVRE